MTLCNSLYTYGPHTRRYFLLIIR